MCDYSQSGVAQKVKRLPAMRETWVRSLGWEDTLEKEMATHSSTLAWKIPWTEKLGRLQFLGSQRVRHDCATSLILYSQDLITVPRIISLHLTYIQQMVGNELLVFCYFYFLSIRYIQKYKGKTSLFFEKACIMLISNSPCGRGNLISNFVIEKEERM